MVDSRKHSWLGIYDYRFALLNLVLKDFRIRYRNMSLGILWSLLNPLVMLGVLVFIFTYVFPSGAVPYYPIFILLGLLSFNFFSACVSCTTNCIIENAPLVKKVIFPRIILPLSVVLSQLIHMFIQLGLLVVFLILFRVPPTRTLLWLVPIYFVQVVFLSGVSLICATLNVYYRDVQYLVQSILTIMFWFTPIFYSLTTVHENLSTVVYGAYILNPLAGLVDGARKAVIFNTHPDTVAFSVAIVVSFFLFFVGIWMFQRYQKNFADRI